VAGIQPPDIFPTSLLPPGRPDWYDRRKSVDDERDGKSNSPSPSQHKVHAGAQEASSQ
jgi:hypothetical protein